MRITNPANFSQKRKPRLNDHHPKNRIVTKKVEISWCMTPKKYGFSGWAATIAASENRSRHTNGERRVGSFRFFGLAFVIGISGAIDGSFIVSYSKQIFGEKFAPGANQVRSME